MSYLFEDVNKAIGKDLYSRNGDVCLGFILERYNLPEWFLEKYYEKLGARNIVRYQILNENFIERYKSNSIIWNSIVYNQRLSEGFILKYKNEFCFDILVRNQILSMNIIEKFFDVSSLDLLCSCQPFIDYNRLIDFIRLKTTIPEDNIEKVKEYLDKNYLYQEYKKGKDWFIGYMFEDELERVKKNMFSIKSWKFFNDYVKNRRRMVKVKVYWDNLLCLGCSSKVYPIREVKYV